jgi:hypothetical protein
MNLAQVLDHGRSQWPVEEPGRSRAGAPVSVPHFPASLLLGAMLRSVMYHRVCDGWEIRRPRSAFLRIYYLTTAGIPRAGGARA